MANTGYGQTLLGRGGGEQCAGTAEKYFLQLSAVKLIQKMAAQRYSAAATAGATGVYILLCLVEDQSAAVGKLSTQENAIFSGKLQKQLLAQLSKVAGYN